MDSHVSFVEAYGLKARHASFSLVLLMHAGGLMSNICEIV